MHSPNYSSIAKQVSISIFAIFLGSQITEGVLLVPYWQSLSTETFYTYYAEFGPVIGRFYTILTIVAALIPIIVAAIYFAKKHSGRTYALLSAIFAILVILCFYVYFKGANGHFYARTFSEADLSKELIVWNTWHWGRIILEMLSLLFLMLAFSKSEVKENLSD